MKDILAILGLVAFLYVLGAIKGCVDAASAPAIDPRPVFKRTAK